MSGPGRSEAEAVLAALTAPSAPGSALATVVGVVGPAYRREGARMVVPAEGPAVGTISGGCLEVEVIDVARAVGAAGRPRLVRLDPTVGDEAFLGWGSGCPGAVEVFVEPLENAVHLVAAMATVRRERCRVAVATMVETSVDRHLGSRIVVHPDGSWEGDLGDEAFHAPARRAAMKALASGRNSMVVVAGWRVFVEVLEPPIDVRVYGAGTDTKPLVEFGERLGWRVTAVDHRSGDRQTAHLDAADRRTCAVVMSHNFAHDLDALASLVAAGVGYIGVLGPRARLERLLDELAARGVVVGAEVLARIHGPAGLDIGAEGPDEIAWAIVAEILAHTRAPR